ncbi:MAG: ATP-binding protein [Methylococcaceae bacterium]|nr:ATP-binding protein [Methylococcaceae bacterium]
MKIRIRLDPEGSRIEVSDNAAGISPEDFARAFRPAEIPLDRTGLSEFGMGMKAAACWFTDIWQVHTKALGEPVARVVRFDIDLIVTNKTENLVVEEIPADPSEHYTVITLEKLGKKFPQARTQKKLKDHLTSIYRIFLRSDDIELLWDEDAKPLAFSEVAILEAPPAATPDVPAIELRRELRLEFSVGSIVDPDFRAVV